MHSPASCPAIGAFAAALALVVLAFASSSGCEFAVPDTVPAFSCIPGPGSCPADMVCASATKQCVAKSQTCPMVGCDAGLSCDTSTLACTPTAGSMDAGPPASCNSLGCACSGPSDCASGICGNELTVTSAVYNAANETSFCTKPCCTSADCDASTVCFATADGGNYCVRPTWLGRSATLGTHSGGAACGADTDCRSGLCAAASCADTCCSTAQSAVECSGGTSCQFGIFPGETFDVHYAAYCAPAAGTGANGSSCTSSSQCLGNLCATGSCHDACRNSADCGSSSQECGYAISPDSTSALIAACSSSLGTGAEGNSCENNNECQSGFCDATSNQCTDVCYADSDCTAGEWHCRPEVVVLGGVSFSYLACGS
jgi:hypothetical protein